MVPKAGRTLPLGKDAADDALARRRLNDVCYVKQLARQDSIVDLELATKPMCNKKKEQHIIYDPHGF